MKREGIGGANTGTGLRFEREVTLSTLLASKPGYRVEKEANKAGDLIYFNDGLVARCMKKYDFYKFLEEFGIDWKKTISKRLLPDDTLYVIIRETLFIIEVKFQQVNGSVDEKLQTCDFKLKQYKKLVRKLHLKVEYVYILNDWFKKPEYTDTLDYIESVNCHYKFNEIPLAWFGLPSK